MKKMTIADFHKLRTETESEPNDCSVAMTEDELKQVQGSCQCPPNGNAHQYDCPKIKVPSRALWERGTEEAKEAFRRAYRHIMPYMSEEDLRKFNKWCEEIGAKM